MKINLEAIAAIESNGDPKAFNEKTGSVGKFQIRQICLDDYNAIQGMNLTMEDMKNPFKSERVASWYLTERLPKLLEHYGVPVTTLTVCLAYNWGPSNVSKWYKAADKQELQRLSNVPRESVNYYRKYCTFIKQPGTFNER